MALAVKPAESAEDVRPLTYDDLLATPENGGRYEIIGGELFVSASPAIRHQRSSRVLLREVDDFVVAGDLGEIFYPPIDVRLSPHNIVVPDLVFVSKERAHIVSDLLIDGAPDLLVEVISPSSKRRDHVRKAALYAMAGVREYWIVDPETKTVDVLRLQNGRYERIPIVDGIARSEVLAGFAELQIEVARLFALPLPS
jgi:Uma2 family endonuclease